MLDWRAALVWRRGSPIWHRFAFSFLVSAGVPLFLLASLGHLELALYTMVGSMQALYGHDRPFRARARLLGALTAGQTVAVVVALVLSCMRLPVAVVVVAGAITVTAQKLACDAARVGPPAHAVLSFVTLAIMFGPETAVAAIPRDLALYLAAAAFAWLVSMAPWTWDRRGPVRHVVASAERLVAAGDERRATAAIAAAWDMLASEDARASSTFAFASRLLHAEHARLGLPLDPVTDAVVLGHLSTHRSHLPRHPVLARLAVGSPLWPAALLCLVGTLAGGLTALALGIGRPYWAIVAAGALYRGSTSVIWERALLRTVGTIGGVGIYALVAPLAHAGDVWLVTLTVLAGFGIETVVSRNYAVANLAVAPMALLLTNVARPQPTAMLMTSRALDTALGALVGLAAAVLLTNRRATAAADSALDAVHRAVAETRHSLDDPRGRDCARRIHLRTRLWRTMADLEDAAHDALGEWRVPGVHAEHVAAALAAGRKSLLEVAQPPTDAPCPT